VKVFIISDIEGVAGIVKGEQTSPPPHGDAEQWFASGVPSRFCPILAGTLEWYGRMSLTLVIHPATTTHYRMSDADLVKSGITAGTVRLSIGLESGADLIEDLDRALNVAAKQAAAKP